MSQNVEYIYWYNQDKIKCSQNKNNYALPIVPAALMCVHRPDVIDALSTCFFTSIYTGLDFGLNLTVVLKVT